MVSLPGDLVQCSGVCVCVTLDIRDNDIGPVGRGSLEIRGVVRPLVFVVPSHKKGV